MLRPAVAAICRKPICPAVPAPAVVIVIVLDTTANVDDVVRLRDWKLKPKWVFAVDVGVTVDVMVFPEMSTEAILFATTAEVPV